MVKHLACIMDGNRRWAFKQGFGSWFGHKKGLDAVQRVIDFCLEKNITYLSLYAFSIENLQRSADEQRYLFEVLAQEALQEVELFKRKNVCIKFVGDRTLFPTRVIPVCEKVEQETSSCSALQLNFLLCYGGRQEIVDAAKRLAVQIAQGNMSVEDVTTDVFEEFLWTSGIPFPDLIVRTGGQQRLSNFLIFQSAYSELYFMDCLWPDISSVELELALTYFNVCQKNFGK